ncbi:Uncharacterised protein [Vibrio cholerae]|nr:Uncharacterised protein [Vibrio cholerae]CSI32955.1 Uncharacterised protein [Vibrio cholerae]
MHNKIDIKLIALCSVLSNGIRSRNRFMLWPNDFITLTNR